MIFFCKQYLVVNKIRVWTIFYVIVLIFFKTWKHYRYVMLVIPLWFIIYHKVGLFIPRSDMIRFCIHTYSTAFAKVEHIQLNSQKHAISQLTHRIEYIVYLYIKVNWLGAQPTLVGKILFCFAVDCRVRHAWFLFHLQPQELRVWTSWTGMTRWNAEAKCRHLIGLHYDDVIMGAVASQLTSLTIVYSTVYSGAHQRKHQSSASLAFVWGIHRGPVNSPHKWPVTRKMFPFGDVIMVIEPRETSWYQLCRHCRHRNEEKIGLWVGGGRRGIGGLSLFYLCNDLSPFSAGF